jgi:predicted nucleic acid-binding protein
LTVVLDADVVIGALDTSDDHHAQARDRFTRWQTDRVPRLLSVVNLTEILIAPAAEPALLRAAREAIAALGITLHSPNEAIAVDAARLRAAHPVSLADGYLLATARHLGAGVASFDRRLLRAASAAGIG